MSSLKYAWDEVELDDFFANREELEASAEKAVFTGKLFNYTLIINIELRS